MPFDVVAWYESAAKATLLPIDAVLDDVYKVVGDDIEVKPEAPFLIGSAYLATSTPKYYEFRQPSISVPYRFYRCALTTGVDGRLAFTNLFRRPMTFMPKEMINAYVMNASDEINMVFAWLSSGHCLQTDMNHGVAPHPKDGVGGRYHITGYSDTTITAGSWFDVPITWDQDLPAGVYSIIGMRVGGYLAAAAAYGAARLVLRGSGRSCWRPGVLLTELGGDKTLMSALHCNDYTLDRWPLMPEIAFDHDQMPDIEVCAAAALTDEVIDLFVQCIEAG